MYSDESPTSTLEATKVYGLNHCWQTIVKLMEMGGSKQMLIFCMHDTIPWLWLPGREAKSV